MPKNCDGKGYRPVKSDLYISARCLPHWQHGGSTYFITFRTNKIELNQVARNTFIEICLFNHRKKYLLWAAVCMPDHVHLLLTPMEERHEEWYSLSGILHSLKSFSAKNINAIMERKGSVWQDESYDRIVRDTDEFYEKWNYIRYNPVNKALCNEPEEWVGLFENQDMEETPC